MRKTCLLSIYDLAKVDDRVVFIGSDITKRDLEKLSEEYADRFFMEGVYEGHIIGMAAGMALNGKMPYINTIATFLTRRCYEQVLLDVGLHNLPVRLIGSGGGTVYAPLGPTHLANEDMGIMRAIPNMCVVAPCDREEMGRLMPLTKDWPGPMYIRLAKGNDEVVSREDLGFEIGKAILMREGTDVLFVTTGITTQMALNASKELEAEGVQATVMHNHTVKPFDDEQLLSLAKKHKAVVSIEEHTLMGGVGSHVAATLMQAGVFKPFKMIGFPDVFTEELGSQFEIMGKYGMSADQIAASARTLLN